MYDTSKKTVSLAGVLIVLSAPPQGVRAQCEATETDTATASDGSFGDQFAYSVAIDGDVAVVGAPQDDDAGAQSGSAFVYSFDGTSWEQQPKLAAADSGPGDQFGFSADISSNIAIFGAPYDGPQILTGSVYVFRSDGFNWNQTKLTPPTSVALQAFGWSVAIGGDVAVVGAPADNQKGAVHVFRLFGDEWFYEQKLTAFDAAVGDHFGEDVALSGNVLIAGAFENDDLGTDCGSAYVFRYNGAAWTFEQKIVPADLASEDDFGKSVALQGDVAAISAWRNDEAALDAGAVYVYGFNGTTWSLEQKLIASDGNSGDRFGSSVDISDGLVIAGAYGDDGNGSGSGSAYLFMYDGFSWIEQAKFVPSNGAASDVFGTSIGVHNGFAVAGAPSATGIRSTTGAAYLYGGLSNGLPDECECPWDLDGGGVGVGDLLALLAAWGTDPGGSPDFDGDHDVDVSDLLALLGHWGGCG